MNILSFAAVAVMAVTMTGGLVVLSRDSRSETNRLFFLICLSISIWLFGGAFGYSSSTKEEAFFWLKVTSPGFIFMHAFVLHFTLNYTKITRGKWIYLLYLPSFVFLYISISGNFVFSDIYREGRYWVMVPDYHSLNFYTFMLNYLAYYIISLLLLYNNSRKTESLRIQKQSRILFAAIIMTILSYNIEPFLAPVFFDYNTYGQAPIYSIIWISFIWYAIDRYRFPGNHLDYMSFDYIDSLNELIVITDPAKKIVRVNKTLQEKTGRDIKPLSLNEIFVEHGLIERLIDSPCEENTSGITLNIITSENKMETVTATLSTFKDRFGDTVGFIISARETPDINSIFKKNGLTGRETQIIKLILSGNSNREIAGKLGIAVRTVETHITNIYGKLGLKNRNELINYCSGIVTQQPDI
ncbi:MAG TPA: LuxR C-terminal-related transcriptional regulator [Spirochaetota bacterium]|nr:LuxR C-terminal-related transcriptional regulator [Spirochaetota bacterium]